jgi:hypothetical protein
MLFVVSLCMSPMMSRKMGLGLELTKLGKDHSHHPKQPSMQAENIDDREEYPINLLLEESLKQ